MVSNPFCIFIGNIIETISPPFVCINESFGVTTLTAIGVTLSGILTYTWNLRQKFYFENFMKFSEAFNRAIYLLANEKESSHFIIHQELPNHFSAMLNFVHILEGDRQDRFKAKWTAYEKKYEEMKQSEFWFADDDPCSAGLLKDTINANGTTALDDDQKLKKELIRLINDLIATAKQ